MLWGALWGALGGSGAAGALYCELPAAKLCLDYSKPLVPSTITIGSDAGNAAIMTDAISYGAYFPTIAEPVGLVGEFLSMILCLVT